MNSAEKGKPFQTLEDLEAYQLAREFRKQMYRVAKGLPSIEKFGLVPQMRRAALSLSNNIAEGHGRYHYLDQLRFLLQARGSLEELIDDLNVCIDEDYLPGTKVDELKAQGWRVHNVINGYGRYLRQKRSGAEMRLQETPTPYYVEGTEDPFIDLDFAAVPYHTF
jgi:four helix bundle protein